MKGEKWARLGINVDDHFKPVYVVSSDRKKIVAELKAALKEVDELYLATDEDREGEAIAWHLQEVLNPKVPVKRMVFHEITPAAITKAVARDPRPRPATGRRPGGSPIPRPTGGLRGLAGALARRRQGPLGRPRAVGRDPTGL